MSQLDKLLQEISDIGDIIAGADQEDLDAINILIEQQGALIDKLGDADDGIVIEEPPVPPDEKDDDKFEPPLPTLVVDYDTEGKVGITSSVDRTVVISGRVRDNKNAVLKANKRKTYSLTTEKLDYVSVDGVEYPITAK